MKKVFLVCLISLLSLPFIFSEEASAAPAPELTNIQIIGVTSDESDYVWENIDFYQQSANTPMGGENGYLAIYIEGTIQQGTFKIHNGGTDITSLTFEALPDEYVTDSAGYVIGKIKYVGFPLSAVSTGRFNVSANNYYPPNNTMYENLFVEVVE